MDIHGGGRGRHADRIPQPPDGLMPLADILVVMRLCGVLPPATEGPDALRWFDEHLLATITGDRPGGQLIMLAGRPATGRTSLALQVAVAAARRTDTVAWFSHQAAASAVALHLLTSQAA